MEIPDLYPDRLSNEEIMKVISDCSDISIRASKRGSNYSLGPSFYNTMAELGQIELNKRIQSNLLSVIEKQRIDNKKSGVLNKVLTAITILLALVTLYIGNESLNFAQSDEKSNDKWKSEQIQLLKENNLKLKRLINEMHKYRMSNEIESKIDSSKQKTTHNRVGSR